MASLSESLVRQLLDNRYIASLATHNSDRSIHMVAVWYLFDGQIFMLLRRPAAARLVTSDPTQTFR
jgi:hypothetical protein